MNQSTLGDVLVTRLRKTDQSAMRNHFTGVTGKIFPVGALVKITTAGKIDTDTAGSDLLVGYVEQGSQEDGGEVVVALQTTAIIRAIAKVALTAGDKLVDVPADTITNGALTVTTYATGKVSAIALTSAGIGEDIDVLLTF